MNLWRAAKARADLIIAVLLGAASFVLYLKTLAPTLLMADGAEFQFASYLLGIAHPTGYPLYLILGWLWSHLLPVGDVAYRINLLSAVFAAGAIGLMYTLTLYILRTTSKNLPRPSLRPIAVVSTLTLAVSSTFWSQSVRAEVYALNSLFVVATLYLLLRWAGQESKPSRTLCLAAFVYGLSLTHHRTMLLLLPAYVLFVWFTDRTALTNLKSLAKLLILVLVPLLLYLYIPWRAPATPYLHMDLAPGRQLELYDNTLRGFLGFVMGEMFRGELGYQASLFERLAMAGVSLANQFTVVGILLGILGLVRLGVGRWKELLLLGLSYLGVVIFTFFYFIGDIHVLYTPSYIIFAIWIALGMGWITDAVTVRSVRFSASEGLKFSLRARLVRGMRVGPYILIPLFALLPLSLLLENYHRADRSNHYQARQWAEEILAQPMPEGAILVSNDRNEITPLLYLQQVEGIRPDLVTLFPLILSGEEYANVVRVIDSVINLERPLYLVKEMPGLEIKYEMELFGPLVEVLSPAVTQEPQNPTDLALNDSLLLVGYDVERSELSPGEGLHVALYWHVEEELGEDYHSYVHLVDEAGNALAQSDHQPGGDYYPTSLWQLGETLLDAHALAIPGGAPAGAHSLNAGMYLYPSMEPLGEGVTLGLVGVSP
jgi:hypothetical protein